MTPVIRLNCPLCGAACAVPESAAGQAVSCPTCGKPFRVGTLAPAPVAPPAPVVPLAPTSADTDEPSGEFGGVSTRRRRPAGAGAGMLPVLVIGVVVLAFLAVGGAVAAYLVFNAEKPAPVAVKPTEKTPEPPPVVEKPATKPAQRTATPPEIRPPVVKDGTSYDFPGVVKEVIVGGGGRYLLFRMPKERKAAIFDANEAKIVKTLPYSDPDIRFAACLDKLFIVSSGEKTIQRWDLEKLTRDSSAPLPVKGVVDAVFAPSAAGGPLWVGVSEGGRPSEFAGPGGAFLDTDTLKPIAIKADPAFPLLGSSAAFSADGSLAVGLGPDGRPTSATLGGGKAAMHQADAEDKEPGRPAPDGKFVYGRTIRTPDLKPVASVGPEAECVPAVHGAFFVRAVPEPPGEDGGDPLVPGMRKWKPGRNPLAGVEFFRAGEATPFAARHDIDPTLRGADGTAMILPADAPTARVILIPKAKLLAFVPADGKKLVLYGCDVEAAAKGEGAGPVVAAGDPPSAMRGSLFSYTLEVTSEKGGTKVRIDAGPEGMRVRDGKVTWNVPADFSEETASALLAVSDDSGWTRFLPLAIRVEGKSPPTTPMPMTADIKPPTLKGGRQTFDMLSPVGDLAIGGGGRYLVLSVPKRREVRIFDVSEAKVTHVVKVAGDPRIAAGMTRFVVASAEDHKLRRFLLATGKEEGDTLAFEGPVPAVALGASSEGPLLFGDKLLKLEDFAPTEAQPPADWAGAEPVRDAVARASADGRTFAWLRPAASPQGLCILTRGEGDAWTFGRTATSPGYAVPSPDGASVFTAKGPVNPQGKPVVGGEALTLPATSGTGFIRIGETSKKDGYQGITAYLKALGKAAGTMADAELNLSADQWKIVPMPLDRRAILIPEAKVIVAVSSDCDKLTLQLLE